MATCSSRGLAVGALLAVAGTGGTLEAQGGPTQAEALALAFPPPAVVERRTAFLTDGLLDSARALAGPGVEVGQQVVTYYVATGDGVRLGVAYFDAHRVRTLREVLMIVVDPDGRARRIEVLRFQEPPDYRPPQDWLARIAGRRLDEGLSLKGDIINMTGATLTSQAVVHAVRRVLALHAVIRP